MNLDESHPLRLIRLLAKALCLSEGYDFYLSYVTIMGMC